MDIISIINFTAPSTGNTFAKLIMWLVSITSSVAMGVILFTLFLKLITLPFDFMSRFSMRKNSIKMEQMRPELEKLQQQYANDKNLYNQKMMALYKKNGYSMFGACLPTIITL
ncbi:MAG: YidC/Oxa1 family membrane protein insertase, partial [Clostridia bacterium]|nr:YidC/Oxa1 family membrane protein insertase [Clostridia bacterium]